MMNLKITFAKILLILLVICLVQSGCVPGSWNFESTFRPMTVRRATKKLERYKQMNDYFMSKNYHDDFRNPQSFHQVDFAEKDRVMYKMMKKNKVWSIHQEGGRGSSYTGYRDSLIGYEFSYLPLVGTVRRLEFDFCSIKKQENSHKSIRVIAPGIYLWSCEPCSSPF